MSKYLTHTKARIKSLFNRHTPTEKPNYFLFTMPRSGSTWLMELLVKQPGFKFCNEPLYLNNYLVRHYSGLIDWEELHDSEKTNVIYTYFSKINQGQLGFLNPSPLGDYFRPFTSRIVYKIIHGGEERINWFRDNFNGKIIYLIRHPMAVSVSRKKLLRLDSMTNSEYGNRLSSTQKILAQKIIKSGSFIQKSVLSWCLQNFVPLLDRTDDWAFVTYEQLVIDPSRVLNYLKLKLDLNDIVNMQTVINKPSLVKSLSDKYTRELLEKPENQEELIAKWRYKVSRKEELELWKIINVFEIDVYNPNQIMPNKKYLIQ